MSQRSSDFVQVMEENAFFKYPAKYFNSRTKGELLSKIILLFLVCWWIYVLVKLIMGA